MSRTVFLVDGARTPFLRATGKAGEFRASDLAVHAGRALLLRQPFSPSALDEVIFGCIMPTPDEVNIARIIALRLGCGDKIPAFTVQRNCASGLQAIDTACRNIAHGYADLILAGGTEAMSHAPLLFRPEMVAWLADWQQAKTLPAKLRQLTRLKAQYFAPVIALLRGLTDPIVGLSMGQTTEKLAYRFGITREQMDAYALRSHQRLSAAMAAGAMDAEIVPLSTHAGTVVRFDDGVRADSSLEKLAKLRPIFDKPTGLVTAGNSSQVTDGAACVLLASEAAVEKYHLPVLAKIHPAFWAGLDPSEMGLGPVHASMKLLHATGLNIDTIDYWEINEAFAGQVLACLQAFNENNDCKHVLGLESVLGQINAAQVNIDGGGISLGHPVGASGARIVLHLAHVLRRKQAQRGIATLCIGGGQGGAMLVEGVAP